MKRCLGFKHSLCVEGRGFAGGIWIGWWDDAFIVREIDRDGQFLHIQIESGIGRFFCTVVYANPQGRGRNELWRKLKRIAENMIEA